MHYIEIIRAFARWMKKWKCIPQDGILKIRNLMLSDKALRKNTSLNQGNRGTVDLGGNTI